MKWYDVTGNGNSAKLCNTRLHQSSTQPCKLPDRQHSHTIYYLSVKQLQSSQLAGFANNTGDEDSGRKEVQEADICNQSETTSAIRAACQHKSALAACVWVELIKGPSNQAKLRNKLTDGDTVRLADNKALISALCRLWLL